MKNPLSLSSNESLSVTSPSTSQLSNTSVPLNEIKKEVEKYLDEIIQKGPALQNAIGIKANLMSHFTSTTSTLNILLKYLLNHNNNPTTYNQTSECIKKLQESLEEFGMYAFFFCH
jgi:hypothetical protein